MKVFLAPIALLVLISGCASQSRVQVRTVEVQVPVVVPCPALTSVGPRPAYPDTNAALQSAPNLFERVKLLLAARALRDPWEIAAEDAMRACGPVSPAPAAAPQPAQPAPR